MEALDLARKITSLLDAKKAQNIEVIKITDISSIADYFVIAGCQSTTQVKALSDEVEFKISEEGISPSRIDGFSTGNWVVLDYGTVIIHILQNSMREFYKLERIWADGEKIDVSDIILPEMA